MHNVILDHCNKMKCLTGSQACSECPLYSVVPFLFSRNETESGLKKNLRREHWKGDGQRVINRCNFTSVADLSSHTISVNAYFIYDPAVKHIYRELLVQLLHLVMWTWQNKLTLWISVCSLQVKAENNIMVEISFFFSLNSSWLEPKHKSFNLLASLHSNPNLWSWALGSDRLRLRKQAAELPSKGVWAQS